MATYAPTVDRVPQQAFLVLALDGEGSAATRDAALEGHLEYIEKNYQRYLTCGPLSEPGGTELIGSFFLVTGENEADVRAFLDGDPYLASGMYAEVRVMSATPAGGRWMGGVIWESAAAIRASSS